MKKRYCARYFEYYETFEWVELCANGGNFGGKRESTRVGQFSQENLSPSEEIVDQKKHCGN